MDKKLNHFNPTYDDCALRVVLCVSLGKLLSCSCFSSSYGSEHFFVAAVSQLITWIALKQLKNWPLLYIFIYFLAAHWTTYFLPSNSVSQVAWKQPLKKRPFAHLCCHCRCRYSLVNKCPPIPARRWPFLRISTSLRGIALYKGLRLWVRKNNQFIVCAIFFGRLLFLPVCNNFSWTWLGSNWEKLYFYEVENSLGLLGPRGAFDWYAPPNLVTNGPKKVCKKRSAISILLCKKQEAWLFPLFLFRLLIYGKKSQILLNGTLLRRCASKRMTSFLECRGCVRFSPPSLLNRAWIQGRDKIIVYLIRYMMNEGCVFWSSATGYNLMCQGKGYAIYINVEKTR